MHMRLFLGIDGGGSRTEACLGDRQGRVLAKAMAGPSNPLKVGMLRAKRELLRAAREVLDRASTNFDVCPFTMVRRSPSWQSQAPIYERAFVKQGGAAEAP